MAQNKATMFFSFVFLLSLVLMVFLADGSRLGIGFQPPTLVCSTVYGAQSGDTCFSVAQAANVTTDVFATLNPNLNCTNIFLGEWLCLNSFNKH